MSIGMMNILSDAALRRMSKAVRHFENEAGSTKARVEPPRPPTAGILVVPTGPPILINDQKPVEINYIPAPDVRVVYPGKFVYRNVDAVTNATWYVDGESCWIQERNNQGLWIGRGYSAGTPSAEYGGQLVVTVLASADPQKLAITAVSPKGTIAGVEYWTATVLMWSANSGIHTDNHTFTQDVVIFDPTGGGFTYDQKVWGKLIGPVYLTSTYGGSGSGPPSYEIAAIESEGEGFLYLVTTTDSFDNLHIGSVITITGSDGLDGTYTLEDEPVSSTQFYLPIAAPDAVSLSGGSYTVEGEEGTPSSSYSTRQLYTAFELVQASGGGGGSSAGFWAIIKERATEENGYTPTEGDCRKMYWAKRYGGEPCDRGWPGGTPDKLVYDVNANQIPTKTNGAQTLVWVPDGSTGSPYPVQWETGLTDFPCTVTGEEPSTADVSANPEWGSYTAAECLFLCAAVLAGNWGVEIGGHIYPIKIFGDGPADDVTGYTP